MLEQPQPDGKSLAEHLRSGERQSGVREPLLDVPDLPQEMEYIWDWFRRISRERGYHDAKPLPLDSTKLLHWGSLRRMRFTAFELGALSQLDFLFLSKRYAKDEPDD